MSKSAAQKEVQKENVDNLRHSDAVTVGVLVADLLRLSINRIDTGCIADLFALSEASLPTDLAADLRNWVTRASNDILDLPEGGPRATLLAEIAALPPEAVCRRLREAVAALAATGSPATLASLEALAARWEGVEPTAIHLPKRASKTVTGASPTAAGVAPATPRKLTGAPRKVSVPKTPAADVDPRRAAYVRDDAVSTLRQYERGVKEGILVAGIRMRSPFKDLTEAEVRSELRRLERERKLKHSAERWLIR